MKDYKQIWNILSTSFDNASYYVCCVDDEEEIRRNGQLTAEFLRQVLDIGPEDRVLEIGCGVARIGRELAPYCKEWHGADISGNMVRYAAERTRDVPNVFLHELPESSLSIFADNSFDCVYCTIVFMHLDKLEMFTYMLDAFRVLKPGGRAYFDTYNLLAPQAWREFRNILDNHPLGRRPGHISQFSTPQEMQKYMQEAGFSDIEVDGSNPQLVVAVGRKPPLPGGVVPPEIESVVRDVPARADDGPPDAQTQDLTPTQLRSEIDRLNKELRDRDVALQEVLAMSSMTSLAIEELNETVHELSGTVERLNETVRNKDRHITDIEQAIDTKNRHIAFLEAKIRKYERLLSLLPVRVALGLRRLARGGKR